MSSILPKNFQNIYVTNIIPDTATSTSSLSATNITATNLIVTTATIPNIILTGSLNANFNSNTMANIFTTGGNVGINTSSPNYRLDIFGTSRINGSTFAGSTSGSIDNIGLFIDGANPGYRLGFIKKSGGGPFFSVANNNNFTFSVANNTDCSQITTNTYSTIMTLTTLGNLTITGTSNSVSLSSGNIFSTNVSSTNVIGTNISSTNFVSTSATIPNIVLTGSLNANFNSNTLGNIFTTAGNVGIGLVTPNAPLQFANVNANRKIVLWQGSNNDHQFYGFGITGSANTLRYQVEATAADHVFYAGINSTTSNEIFRISGTGNTTVTGTTNSVSLSSGNIFSTNVSSTNLVATTSTIPNVVFTNITTVSLLATTQVSSAGLFSTNITSTNILGTNTSLTNLICSTGTFANKVGGSQTVGTILVTTSANLSGNSNTIGNIFTTGGNVGVGTVTPAFTLDIAGSLRVSSLFVNSSSIIATGGTTTLTTAANTNQFVVGTAGHTVLLPNSTGLAIGAEYYIVNQSTQAVTVGNNAATAINILYPGVSQFYTLTSNTAAGGTWGILGSNFFNASTGNMGFNNTNPGTSLDIIGSSRVLGMNYIGNPNNTADNLGTFIDGNNNGLGYRLGIIKKNGGGPFFAVNNVSNFTFAAANNTDASQITTNSYTTVMTLSTQGHLVINGGFTSGSHLISSGNLTINNTTATSVGALSVFGPGNSGYTPATTTIGQLASFYGPSGGGINCNFDISTYLPTTLQNFLPSVRFNMLDLGSGNSTFNILTKNSGTTATMASRIMIDGSGNVGINNTNPSYTLDVAGTTRIFNNSIQGVYLGNPTAANSFSTILATSRGSLEIGIAGALGNFATSATAGDIILRSNTNNIIISTSSTGGQLYLATSGNIGIQNTAPTYTLDISGTLQVNNGSKIVVSGGLDGTSARGIYMYASNDTNWGIYMASSGAGKSLANASAVAGAGFSSNAIRYRVPNVSSQGFIFENTAEVLLSSIRGSDGLAYFSGNVGISTTNPTYTLDVAGTTRITNTTATSMGTLIVAGPGNSGYTPATATSGQLASFYGPGGAGAHVNIDLSTFIPNSGNMSLPGVRLNVFDLGSTNCAFNILTKNSGAGGTMGSRIYIDGSGNVGINTTNPNSKLHIYESTGTSPGPNAGSLIISRGNTGGSSCITFPSVINNGSDYGYIAFVDNVAGGLTYNGINYNYFANSQTAGGEIAALIIGCENDSGAFNSSNAGPDSVIISPFGNVAITPKNNITYIGGNNTSTGSAFVGIGTPNPLAPLHISTNGTQGLYAGPFTFTSTAAGTLPNLLYKTQAVFNSNVNGWPATTGTVGNAIALRIRGNDDACMDFGVNSGNGGWIQNTNFSPSNANAYSLNYPLSLNPNGGNVSINTTGGLAYGLDVLGITRIAGGSIAATSTNGTLILTGGDSFGHTLYIATSAVQKRTALNNNGTTGNLFSYDYGSATPLALQLQAPGGTTQIGSTALFTTNGNLTCTGDVLAYGSISDQRLKTNIQTITSEFAIDTVKKLNPVTFNWKENVFNTEKQNKFDSGFIAQEVNEILEHAVGEYTHFETGTVYKNLKHERIVPYLTASIKYLLVKVDELEEKLKNI